LKLTRVRKKGPHQDEEKIEGEEAERAAGESRKYSDRTS
jgi:hypothetical protein